LSRPQLQRAKALELPAQVPSSQVLLSQVPSSSGRALIQKRARLKLAQT
jgi:hypothetical protein